MATHSGVLAWKIPWTEEPGRLQFMGWLRVGHDWVTSLSLFTFMYWRRKWQPTPVFLPGESQGWGAWWAAVYGVAQSRTGLKWLSSSSPLNRMGCFWKILTLMYISWRNSILVDRIKLFGHLQWVAGTKHVHQNIINDTINKIGKGNKMFRTSKLFMWDSTLEAFDPSQINFRWLHPCDPG